MVCRKLKVLKSDGILSFSFLNYFSKLINFVNVLLTIVPQLKAYDGGNKCPQHCFHKQEEI
jgi:hypothetical protein